MKEEKNRVLAQFVCGSVTDGRLIIRAKHSTSETRNKRVEAKNRKKKEKKEGMICSIVT